MKGVGVLRIALNRLAVSMEPLTAATFSYRSRDPQNLAGLEQLVVEHLADVEDALAHVRRMRHANDA